MKFLKTISYICALLVLVIAAPASSQGEMKKLTVAEAGRLFIYMPLYYAIDKGFFKKEGLDVSMFTANRRDLAMKAVIAGESFASVHDPIEAALAKSRGADVKIIAPVVDVAAIWLVGDADITADTKTWRGKTAALPTPPNTNYSMFMKELRDSGWVAVDPVTYKMANDNDPAHYLKISLGSWGTQLPVLMGGRANLSVLLEPEASTVVLKAHMHVIRDYPKLLGPFLFSSINVAGDTIRKDPATVEKFMNALTMAYRDAASHPSAFAEVAGRWFPNADPAVIKRAVNTMIEEKSFTASSVFKKSDFEKNQKYFALAYPDSPALKVTWSEVTDTSFAERATKYANK